MTHKSYNNPYSPQTREVPQDVETAAEAAHIEEGRDTEAEIVEKMVENEQVQEHQAGDAQFEADLHSAQAGVNQAQTATQAQTTPAAKSEFLIQIENIMSDGLGDIYTGLEPTTKTAFKQTGEQVSRKIEDIIGHGKTKVKEILNLIKEWLKMIPGVNKFFLEQEAKIKTDRIMGMGLGKY